MHGGIIVSATTKNKTHRNIWLTTYVAMLLNVKQSNLWKLLFSGRGKNKAFNNIANAKTTEVIRF